MKSALVFHHVLCVKQDREYFSRCCWTSKSKSGDPSSNLTLSPFTRMDRRWRNVQEETLSFERKRDPPLFTFETSFVCLRGQMVECVTLRTKRMSRPSLDVVCRRRCWCRRREHCSSLSLTVTFDKRNPISCSIEEIESDWCAHCSTRLSNLWWRTSTSEFVDTPRISVTRTVLLHICS